MPTVLQTAEAVTIATAEKALTALEAQYAKSKAEIVQVVQQHIVAHTAEVVAHQAEVDAATALIQKAVPNASNSAANAAALVLTAPKGVAAADGWIAKNWRYLIIASVVAIVVYGFTHGMIKI